MQNNVRVETGTQSITVSYIPGMSAQRFRHSAGWPCQGNAGLEGTVFPMACLVKDKNYGILKSCKCEVLFA